MLDTFIGMLLVYALKFSSHIFLLCDEPSEDVDSTVSIENVNLQPQSYILKMFLYF